MLHMICLLDKLIISLENKTRYSLKYWSCSSNKEFVVRAVLCLPKEDTMWGKVTQSNRGLEPFVASA
jgi:hypothetical protein